MYYSGAYDNCGENNEDGTKIDGNKRIGVHAMLVFLALNGYELVYTQAELIDIILSLADGKVEYEELLQWIINHQK